MSYRKKITKQLIRVRTKEDEPPEETRRLIMLNIAGLISQHCFQYHKTKKIKRARKPQLTYENKKENRISECD